MGFLTNRSKDRGYECRMNESEMRRGIYRTLRDKNLPDHPALPRRDAPPRRVCAPTQGGALTQGGQATFPLWLQILAPNYDYSTHFSLFCVVFFRGRKSVPLHESYSSQTQYIITTQNSSPKIAKFFAFCIIQDHFIYTSFTVYKKSVMHLHHHT